MRSLGGGSETTITSEAWRIRPRVGAYPPAPIDNVLTDTLISTTDALAALKSLNASLLSGPSATEALELWCAAHSATTPPQIRAEAVDGPEKPINADQRSRLRIGPDEPTKYRRVRLTCGDYILSEADNWYVPSLLTPEMNARLDATSTPFGKVVADLDFTRETFATEIGWPVLPHVWHEPPLPDAADDVFDAPPVLFVHRALLYDRDHRPFSEVNEYYRRELLDFVQGK